MNSRHILFKDFLRRLLKITLINRLIIIVKVLHLSWHTMGITEGTSGIGKEFKNTYIIFS